MRGPLPQLERTVRAVDDAGRTMPAIALLEPLDGELRHATQRYQASMEYEHAEPIVLVYEIDPEDGSTWAADAVEARVAASTGGPRHDVVRIEGTLEVGTRRRPAVHQLITDHRRLHKLERELHRRTMLGSAEGDRPAPRRRSTTVLYIAVVIGLAGLTGAGLVVADVAGGVAVPLVSAATVAIAGLVLELVKDSLVGWLRELTWRPPDEPPDLTLLDATEHAAHCRALTDLICSVEQQRCVIIDAFDRLDATSKDTVLQVLANRQLTHRAPSLWVIIEDSVAAVARRGVGQHSWVSVFRQQPLTVEQRRQLANAVGAPQLLERATVGGIRRSGEGADRLSNSVRGLYAGELTLAHRLVYLLAMSQGWGPDVSIGREFIVKRLVQPHGARQALVTTTLQGEHPMNALRAAVAGIEASPLAALLAWEAHPGSGEMVGRPLAETGRALAQHARELGLADPKVVHVFWAILWYDSVREGQWHVSWIRKIRAHLVAAGDLASVELDLTDTLVDRLLDVVLDVFDTSVAYADLHDSEQLAATGLSLVEASEMLRSGQGSRRRPGRATVSKAAKVFERVVAAYAVRPTPGLLHTLRRLEARLGARTEGEGPHDVQRLAAQLFTPQDAEWSVTNALGVKRDDPRALLAKLVEQEARWCATGCMDLVDAEATRYLTPILHGAGARSKAWCAVVDRELEHDLRRAFREMNAAAQITSCLALWNRGRPPGRSTRAELKSVLARLLGAVRGQLQLPTSVDGHEAAAQVTTKLDELSNSIGVQDAFEPIPTRVLTEIVRIVRGAPLLAKTRSTAVKSGPLQEALVADTLLSLAAVAALGATAAEDGDTAAPLWQTATDAIHLAGFAVDGAPPEGVLPALDGALHVMAAVFNEFGLDVLAGRVTLRRLHLAAVGVGLDLSGPTARGAQAAEAVVDDAIELVGRSASLPVPSRIAQLCAAAAVCSAVSEEISARFLIDCSKAVEQDAIGAELRAELGWLALFHSSAFNGLGEHEVAKQAFGLADDKGRAQLAARLEAVPDDQFAGVLRVMTNALDKRDLEAAEQLTQVLRVRAAACTGADAERLTNELDTYRLEVQIAIDPGSVRVGDELAQWAPRRDSDDFFFVAYLLLSRDVSPTPHVELVSSAFEAIANCSTGAYEDRNGPLLLAIRVLQRLDQPDEEDAILPSAVAAGRAAALDLLGRAIPHWEDKLAVETTVECYRLLYAEDRDRYRGRLDHWSELRERTELLAARKLIDDGRYFELFCRYVARWQYWGLAIDDSSDAPSNRPFAAPGTTAVSWAFIERGRADDQAPAVNRAARDGLITLVNLVPELPGLPPRVQAMLRLHREYVLHGLRAS